MPWLDAKLYGSTQVVDEGRHVEVFHTYLTQKLGKLYEIDDNLYVVIDALMSDARWDMKFLGMQIMIEGLALGAFGAIRQITMSRSSGSCSPRSSPTRRGTCISEFRAQEYPVPGERERREREDGP